MKKDSFLENPQSFIIDGSLANGEGERRNLNEIEKARAALEGRKPKLIKPNPLRLAKETVERIRDARVANKEYKSLLKQRDEFIPKMQELQAEIGRLRVKIDRMDYGDTPRQQVRALSVDKALLHSAQELMFQRYSNHYTWLHGAIRDAAQRAGINEIEAIRGTIAQDKAIAAERLQHASQSGADLAAWLDRVDNADLKLLEEQIAAGEAPA